MVPTSTLVAIFTGKLHLADSCPAFFIHLTFRDEWLKFHLAGLSLLHYLLCLSAKVMRSTLTHPVIVIAFVCATDLLTEVMLILLHQLTSNSIILYNTYFTY